MEKIPYGISNFDKLRTENYYFIDKTKYIEELENLGSPYLFFLRPRRFGKSLFVSMLEYYYDISHKSEFDRLFEKTYIRKKPTPLRNSFSIFKLNFSMVRSNGTLEEIQQAFEKYISISVKEFLNKYKKLYGITNELIKEILSISTDSGTLVTKFYSELNKKNVKTYLIIDEYDNFANNILIEHGEKTYTTVTHASGFLRSFFTVIKGHTDSRKIDRLFITGVSPLVMTDVTSGFNIGDNISLLKKFNSMVGFNNDEINEIVNYYAEYQIFNEDVDNVISTLSYWYKGYQFSKKKEIVYNSVMTLFYINRYITEEEAPDNLIDINIRTDFAKLKYLLLLNKKLNGNFDTIKSILTDKGTSGKLYESFAIGEKITDTKFKSLLYYLGLLTIKSIGSQNMSNFVIPNKVIELMLWEYIRKALNESYELKINTDLLAQEFFNMAYTGKWQTALNYILDKFYEAVSVRDFVFHEEGIKTFMLAYFNTAPLFNVTSETEFNQGFADIYLRPEYTLDRNIKYGFIIEIKYLKASEINNKAKKKDSIKKAISEAKNQLLRYTKYEKSETIKIIIVVSASEKLYIGKC